MFTSVHFKSTFWFCQIVLTLLTLFSLKQWKFDFVPLASVQGLLDAEVSPSVTAENHSLWWVHSELWTQTKQTNPSFLMSF